MSVQDEQSISLWFRGASGTIEHGAYIKKASAVWSLPWRANERASEVGKDCSYRNAG